jgi:phosphatidylinositol glycan class B
MALYYWPWTLLAEPRKAAALIPSIWQLRASLSLAAFAVVLRPTNILIWATVAFMVLTRCNLVSSSSSSFLPVKTVLVLFREALLCGSLVLAASFASDYLYFGFWTFPPYKWLNFNVSQSLAVFYGRNPWHYYLLQGIPLLCTTSLPFALGAMYQSFFFSVGEGQGQANTLRVLLYAVFVTVGALSLISHKEVRFIYPLLPILSILSAPLAASFFTTTTTAATATDPSASSNNKPHRPSIRRKPLLFLGLSVNVFLAGYLGFLHQAAPLTVLSYLRQEYERIHPTAARLPLTTSMDHHHPTSSSSQLDIENDDDQLFALFLMPCHSTPWRSHLVYPNLHAYALSCEPPLHTKPGTVERETYRDEADRFYDDPVGFLRGELFGLTTGAGSIKTLPRFIIGFQGIEPWLRQFLQTREGGELGIRPQKVWEGFNGFFNEDWRRAGKMVVWDTGLYENAPSSIE